MIQKKPNDGGPASPTVTKVSSSTTQIDKVEGMNLRDWFAGMALSGMVDDRPTPDAAAKWAYEIADAMIRAREHQAEGREDG